MDYDSADIMASRISAEVRQGFLLIAAAILRCDGSSDNAMTLEGATKLAERLSDMLRGE